MEILNNNIKFINSSMQESHYASLHAGVISTLLLLPLTQRAIEIVEKKVTALKDINKYQNA